MRQYPTITIISVLTIALIVPFIATSNSGSHHIKLLGNPPLDTTFISSFKSSILAVKIRLLNERIKAAKDNSSCVGPEGQVCENLKKQWDRLLADVDITLQKQVNQRLIY